MKLSKVIEVCGPTEENKAAWERFAMKISEHPCPKCGKPVAGDNPKMLCFDCGPNGKKQ